MEFNDKKIHRITGAAVFVIALISYLMTVSPTLSYWDCSEFAAAAYIMGVPHPPGSPFFTMLGRIFTMIPFSSDIGFRVNMISVLASVFSVLFLYLISVRLIKLWRGEVKNWTDAFITFGGPVIGALTFCYTDTFWFNGVEAEVYALSMFFTAIVVWLGMVWVEKHKEADSSRYLLLIILLIGLGTGVHLMNILTIPSLLFLMWFYDKRTTIITAIGMMLSMVVLFGIQPQQKLYALGILIALTIILKLSLKSLQEIEKGIDEDINLIFIMPILLIIGYSTYVMIFVRAGLNPPMNENDPSNWDNFLAYLNREQYGDTPQLTNSVKLMFGDIGNRAYLESLAKMGITQGSEKDVWGSAWSFFWNYQIVEMYVRYFNWQFIGKNIDDIKAIISFKGMYGIPFLVGVWGFLHHFFKDWKKALAFTFLFIVMSIGLVIYQNQDVWQPRERDYFYVGSFFVFAIWIGLGITSLMEYLAENNLKKLIMPLFCLSLIVPGLVFSSNHYTANRKGNFVASDYSRNILETCEPNAILFTNGDNDTFPLWYLQEVEKLRTDVVVVNLSLLNTDWYIKQLKAKLPELIKYTDQEIINNFSMHPDKQTQEGFMSRYWPKAQQLEIPTADGKGKVQWNLEPTMQINIQGKQEGFIRIQDQLILEMVAYNANLGWKRPIYFAVTVANSCYIGIDEYLRMDGLCYRITDKKTNQEVDPAILYDRLLVRYKDYYRNLGDKSVYYDDNINRLLQNYRSAFLQLANYYVQDLKQQPMTTPSTGTAADQVSAQTGMDPKKDYSFAEFDKLTSQQKISFLLNKMEFFVPSYHIPYNSEFIQMQIAALYNAIGDKKSGDAIMKNLNVDKMSRNNRLRMAYTALVSNFDDFGKELLDKEIAKIVATEEPAKQVESLLEIYRAYGQAQKPEMAADVETKIMQLIDGLEPAKQGEQYKEFGLFAYQGQMPENAIRIMTTYTTKNPSDIEGQQYLLQMLMMQNRDQEAITVLDKLIELTNGAEQFKEQKIQLQKKNASFPVAGK